MAAFVSLVTCHHCPVVTSRRGLVYRDSLSVLSRNLRAPGGLHHRPPPTRQQVQGPHSKQAVRLTRPDLPGSSALACSKPRPCSMKHLVLSHLRKLLSLSRLQQRQRLHLKPV